LDDLCGPKYPAISPSRWADWYRLTVFFDFSPKIRKVIYTTNAIELLSYSLRRLLKKRGIFPNDDSIMEILYLAINQVAKKRTMPIRDCKKALNQFVIISGWVPIIKGIPVLVWVYRMQLSPEQVFYFVYQKCAPIRDRMLWGPAAANDYPFPDMHPDMPGIGLDLAHCLLKPPG
jgi:hypothetical protein